MRNRDKCIIIKIYFTPETPVTLSRIALNIDNENLRRKREGNGKSIWKKKEIQKIWINKGSELIT